jgi:hypothetical protein
LPIAAKARESARFAKIKEAKYTEPTPVEPKIEQICISHGEIGDGQTILAAPAPFQIAAALTEITELPQQSSGNGHAGNGFDYASVTAPHAHIQEEDDGNSRSHSHGAFSKKQAGKPFCFRPGTSSFCPV